MGLALQVAGCAALPALPAHGRLGPYQIATTVDSPAARYYLEHYLAGERTEPELHVALDALHLRFGGRLPTREELADLSRAYSVDLAALVFARQLLAQPGNAALQERFLTHLDRVRRGTFVPPSTDYRIVLVPGFDYVEHGAVTGADFAKPRRILDRYGMEVLFVAIDPLGSVEENAATIVRTLDAQAGSRRPQIVAGASSAGPAIHLALGQHPEWTRQRQVRAWLNLGGILQGSPVIDWADSGWSAPLFHLIVWWEGARGEVLHSMRADVSRRRAETLHLPADLLVVNYLGLSLSGDISRFARDKYLIMRDLGPNDGLTLLPDALPPGSLTILAPRSDHFFAEDPLIDEKTVALLATMLELLE